MHVLAVAKQAAIAKERTCGLLRIQRRRVERWAVRIRATGDLTDRPPGPCRASHALLPVERQAVLAYVSEAHTVDYSLQALALKGAEAGQFFMSASSVRSVLQEAGLLVDRRRHGRRTGAGQKPHRPPELTGPNQCWCWDFSYLLTDLPRVFWYLWVLLDEWSRKVLAWRISARIMQQEAQALIDEACVTERLLDVPLERRPVIVNDRGTQMKAKPVKQMCIDLGLTQEFARPRTPNDNPFVEALFSTVKSAPVYPGRFPSDDITNPQQYFERYLHWYNTEHYHSRIGYVHPIDKHQGRAEQIIKERKIQLVLQRKKRTLYWTTQSTFTRSRSS